jgi:hypothetical protein
MKPAGVGATPVRGIVCPQAILAAVALPERKTVFHMTASAHMSDRMARHRHRQINYFHPIESDHGGDAQRHQKLIQKSEH